MLTFVSGIKEHQWHTGCPFPRNLNPGEVSEVQADCDELLYVKRLCPDYPPQKVTDHVQSWFGAYAYAIASAIYREAKRRSYSELAEEEAKQPRIVFTGETVRVSAIYVENWLGEQEYEKDGKWSKRVVVEENAGRDVFGNKQWAVVKDPDPQLFELAKELAK